MGQYEWIAPCHFGLESVLKREIGALGYDIQKVEDGKVTFSGDESGFARGNLFLRTTERLLWKVGEFSAESFEELFCGIKEIPWEDILPADAKFWVAKATSVKSKLFSTSDIQSIVKKAIVERMKQTFGITWFPESGNSYPIRISILKDVVTVGIDTSGESLHKRGYRKLVGKAPLSETLAAALLMLTPWNKDRILVDPFCGSGTIPIEAAMLGCNMAPGRVRTFLAETWKERIPAKVWQQAREEADDLVRRDVRMQIEGYDIDRDMIQVAKQNAAAAGVAGQITFAVRPVKELRHGASYGFLITNPPYGERLEEKSALPALYTEMGQAFARLDTWSYYVITSYEEAQKYFGRKADKNRKIYNGMIKTYFYQYMGPKPPMKTEPSERRDK